MTTPAAPGSPSPRKTPLADRHVQAGARMIDFGGWLMPVQYRTGILDEHRTVREAVGLFDVSHMGEVEVRGPRAADAVQRVVTNDVGRLGDGDALYTCTLREDAGIVDDLIVYRHAADHFLIVVNASTADKDFAHFQRHAGDRATFTNRSDDYALLSLQGPRALALLSGLVDAGGGELPPRAFTFRTVSVGGKRLLVSRTGYTGEDGVEIFVPPADAGALWDLLLERGADVGCKPIGLGARDTLRLEARLSLYGNDIDEQHNPHEAGLGWVVKGSGYVGEEALKEAHAAGVTRKLVGFKVEGRGIPRHGYPIFDAAGPQAGSAIGIVTSGTVGPTVGGAIGLGYVPTAFSTPGTRLAVDCRGKSAAVEVVKGPFYTRKTS